MPSIWKIFYEEVVSPFYVFQLFSIILWLCFEYVFYAFSIIIITGSKFCSKNETTSIFGVFLVTDHMRCGPSCPRIPTIVHDKTCHQDFGGFQKRPSDSIIRFSDTWFLSLSIVVLLGSPSR